ncbi:RelA/SpoT domain-containing protein [Vibrio parahaemolyticus]|uniref:RelA/SpoT domain-containing protein n=2 Tax=Vibrio TaxID=662 RepID=UPI00288CC669|nr:RelA/SpoT domain-containing protein [Vibrio parahaemolyticus]EJC7024267.1 RelA/SpoT domain-containing protein [Vibrio parahaemolyticus]EJC7173824.1 RelA/SpoT domain-containing protein [Vibrio parahaemolyticus]EJF4095456.1 RelA/SpoT domain-containing protein [Vibrio parahaemolyticus]EJX1281651.1 RelA/SpoT domain-containing protein [Vibrio parahaemolyticus]
MAKNKELESFLDRNKISESDWQSSKVKWETLKSIGQDHSRRFEQRKETAELFARVIQRCDKVHSVRWRVKDPEHLMEKIVRKTMEGSESYNEAYVAIDESNYHEIVTDLVGIRALHLFKDDCFDIDEYLRDVWVPKESPVYYVRVGDEPKLEIDRFVVKTHPAGYRSLHYVFESQPMNQKVYTEVQVRTIFEEGWSEIDHNVRYPNFSDNEQVAYFLKIFNRLAGSADEMGTFVKDLVNDLEERARELGEIKAENAKIKLENEHNISEIDRLFSELDSSEGQNRTQSKLVKDLKSEVEKLKTQTQKATVISLNRDASKRVHASKLQALIDSIQGDLNVTEKNKDIVVKRRNSPPKP